MGDLQWRLSHVEAANVSTATAASWHGCSRAEARRPESRAEQPCRRGFQRRSRGPPRASRPPPHTPCPATAAAVAGAARAAGAAASPAGAAATGAPADVTTSSAIAAATVLPQRPQVPQWQVERDVRRGPEKRGDALPHHTGGRAGCSGKVWPPRDPKGHSYDRSRFEHTSARHGPHNTGVEPQLSRVPICDIRIPVVRYTGKERP
mmetsp:Transcript_22440/g.63022  ORF Transcript_22440/g.63022 Transcript_22440/m.63022 type:complete len:206 (-) Transcript_22440:648-1265(-)